MAILARARDRDTQQGGSLVAAPTLVVAMTGASGAVYGVRMLEVLRDLGVRTELVISDWANTTIKLETGRSLEEIRDLATVTYSATNQAAPIASGSHRVDGMAIVPCSMKTLAAIANGYGASLIHRAADVMLKERKPLPPGAARDAAQCDSASEHAGARPPWRNHHAADARFLQSPRDHRRSGQPLRGPGP